MATWYAAKVQALRYEDAVVELARRERDFFKLENELLCLKIKKLEGKNKGENFLRDTISVMSDHIAAVRSEVEALREALSVNEAKTKELLAAAPVFRSRPLTDIMDVMCVFYSVKFLGRTYVCYLGSIDCALVAPVVDLFAKKFNARLRNPGLYEIHYDGSEVKACVIPRGSWSTYNYYPTAATQQKTDSQPRSTGAEPGCSTLPRGTGIHTYFDDEDDADELQ
ncbi:uncharacterized protein [Coffea arabica]